MSGSAEILLAGDVNLMGLQDPRIPFAEIRDEFRDADFVFANLECCLYRPPAGVIDDEAYFADPDISGEALKLSGIQAVGVANNVNYGAAAIAASLTRLREIGVPAIGAGDDRKSAEAPLIVESNGLKLAVLQRSAIYWPDQEATEEQPGIAVIKAHTAYREPPLRVRRPGLPPANRPGIPPIIETWADKESLASLVADVRRLREEADIVVVSLHWGLFAEVLQYMTDFAEAAIDAGADVVFGHGPHDHLLPVVVRQGRPIFYNLGALSFRYGPNGKTFQNWIGMVVRLFVSENGVERASLKFVHQDANLAIHPVLPGSKSEVRDDFIRESGKLGTEFHLERDELVVKLERERS